MPKVLADTECWCRGCSVNHLFFGAASAVDEYRPRRQLAAGVALNLGAREILPVFFLDRSQFRPAHDSDQIKQKAMPPSNCGLAPIAIYALAQAGGRPTESFRLSGIPPR